MTAADRWREQLAAWAIPDDDRRRTRRSRRGGSRRSASGGGARRRPLPTPTPTTRRALEALPAGGTVLDVGVGGGATSLPLAGRAGSIVGIDEQADMLEGFLANAAAAGVEARAVRGTWPDAAAEVEPADVVVAGHVFYNVAASSSRSRARSTRTPAAASSLELTERHPLDWMRDLWLRFHDLERPDGPTADDAARGARASWVSGGREDRLIAGDVRRRRVRHAARTRSTRSASGCACPPIATRRSRTRSATGCASATACGTSGRRSGPSSRCGGTA